MEYYITSLIISIIIFVFVYLSDYKNTTNDNNDNNDTNDNNDNNDNTKTLFTTNNLLLFIIIYIVATIISFYLSTSSISLTSLSLIFPAFLLNLFKPPMQAPPLIRENGDDIDPKILSKINDNLDIGFSPPNIDNNDIETNN